jgi:hypothetical protein
MSKDRLKDLEGNLLFYTDDTYTKTTTRKTEFPAFVRVGPYNVNPETSIEFASVISHEYGHSLGLPDYYSTGSRDTYGDFNLMATDKGHHMDIIGKKELGWIVPEVLRQQHQGGQGLAGQQDRHRHHLVGDAGRHAVHAVGRQGDYGIHNGEAYAAALPGRQLIDPRRSSRAPRASRSGTPARATTSAARPSAATTSTSRSRPRGRARTAPRSRRPSRPSSTSSGTTTTASC